MAPKFELEIDVPNIPHLSLINISLRVIEGICAFFAMMLISKTIAVENHYYGGTLPTPGWTMFVALYSFVIVFLLLFFPFMYERTQRFKRLSKFLIKPRSTFVLSMFNLVFWLIDVIAISVFTNESSTCNYSPDDLKTYGQNYGTDIQISCATAKAAEGFAWIAFFSWLTSFLIAGKVFYDEKQASRRHPKPDNMSFIRGRDENASTLGRSDTHGTVRSEDLEAQQQTPYMNNAQPPIQMHPIDTNYNNQGYGDQVSPSHNGYSHVSPVADPHESSSPYGQAPPHDYYQPSQPPQPPQHQQQPIYQQPIPTYNQPAPVPATFPVPVPTPSPQPTGYIPGPYAQGNYNHNDDIEYV